MPEPNPDLSDLVTPLLAQRVRGEQMLVVPVIEHLLHFEGRFLEQHDGSKVVVVRAAERWRRLQCADPRLGPSVGRQRSVNPSL